jgi:Mrp family chromosome partitioning ATPase
VDADFRAPIQHEIWNIDNKKGLKDVIANVEELDCASQLVFPRLTVLTTGNYLNNPMTLLGSKGMALVLSQIKNRFNYVIFDAPPLLGTADASLLAKLLGNLIIVTRIGATEASNAKQVNEIIAQAEIKVLGLAINDSKSSSRTDRRYNKRMALEKENSSISEVFRDRELNLSSDTTSNASRNFKHG